MYFVISGNFLNLISFIKFRIIEMVIKMTECLYFLFYFMTRTNYFPTINPGFLITQFTQ